MGSGARPAWRGTKEEWDGVRETPRLGRFRHGGTEDFRAQSLFELSGPRCGLKPSDRRDAGYEIKPRRSDQNPR